METKKEDRRVRRTKKLLTQALTQLLHSELMIDQEQPKRGEQLMNWVRGLLRQDKREENG